MKKYHLTLKSSNVKTGDIPVSTSPKNNCPPTCGMFNNGCYGDNHGINFHWKKVSSGERGLNWSEFIALIQGIAEGSIWRHNQVGDLEGFSDNDEAIDPVKLYDLVEANTGKRGFTYTHKTNLKENHQWIKLANQKGFTINLSGDNLAHADDLYELGIAPVVTILPSDAPKKLTTPKGHTVVTCPQSYTDGLTCKECKLCAVSERTTIIGFPAHGSGYKKVNKVFEIKAV